MKKTISIRKLISSGLVNPDDIRLTSLLSEDSKGKYLSKNPTSSIDGVGFYFFDGTTLYKYVVPSENYEIKIYARRKK